VVFSYVRTTKAWANGLPRCISLNLCLLVKNRPNNSDLSADRMGHSYSDAGRYESDHSDDDWAVGENKEEDTIGYSQCTNKLWLKLDDKLSLLYNEEQVET